MIITFLYIVLYDYLDISEFFIKSLGYFSMCTSVHGGDGNILKCMYIYIHTRVRVHDSSLCQIILVHCYDMCANSE